MQHVHDLCRDGSISTTKTRSTGNGRMSHFSSLHTKFHSAIVVDVVVFVGHTHHMCSDVCVWCENRRIKHATHPLLPYNMRAQSLNVAILCRSVGFSNFPMEDFLVAVDDVRLEENFVKHVVEVLAMAGLAAPQHLAGTQTSMFEKLVATLQHILEGARTRLLHTSVGRNSSGSNPPLVSANDRAKEAAEAERIVSRASQAAKELAKQEAQLGQVLKAWARARKNTKGKTIKQLKADEFFDKQRTQAASKIWTSGASANQSR